MKPNGLISAWVQTPHSANHLNNQYINQHIFIQQLFLPHKHEVVGSKPTCELIHCSSEGERVKNENSNLHQLNGVAQRKRVGPITQRSEDRNLLPLKL